MKQFFRKTLSGLLALSLACGLAVPAAASEALGDDLTQKETLLNEETQLSTNVFWSTTYSDFRTENFITYTPNDDVLPIVTAGDVLTARDTVSKAAAKLEEEGYRVVAGVNGDFYNVGNGLPIGIVVTEGELRSSDGGYHAIGFLEDGTAILGKPGVSVTADLGYGVDNGGGHTQIMRKVMGVNKARVSTGGIYLYTYDFNDRHTTGNTEAGIDVLCTIEEGSLAIGEQLVLSVDRVMETAYATTMKPDQVVLSANLKSDSYYVDALRNVPEGTEIVLNFTPADEAWSDVEYAIGALYSLVENGKVVSGLAAGASPRTAVGQKADGTLIFYTIDGRKAGHSIGASLTQVAQRLIELGCETALCLDGGGSTTMAVTQPDDVTVSTVNSPSDGTERGVTNQIFLVASSRPSNKLSHFYVNASSDYVLAGSAVPVTVSGVDSHYIPMDADYTLSASGGSVEEKQGRHLLTTPAEGGDITVTASGRGAKGSTVVRAIRTPDTLTIKNGESPLTSLTLTPGASVNLSAESKWNHIRLRSDGSAETWSFEGNCGRMDGWTFYAGNPGNGTIRVSAGEKTAEIPVTVTKVPLQTVEDFEKEKTIFDGVYADNAWFSRVSGSEQVHLGRGAGKLEYKLTAERWYDAEWRAISETAVDNRVYTALNLWVYGDGSGNELYLIYSNGTKGYLETPITTLDFTGWKQVSVSTSGDHFDIQGLGVRAPVFGVYVNENGDTIYEVQESVREGTVYVDHIVASFVGTVDNEVPVIKAELDTENWVVKGKVSDEADGVLAKEFVNASINGTVMKDVEYSEKTGELKVYLPGPGETQEAMRVTITAKDASGNIGRASVDTQPFGVEHKFTDIASYWGATYVDFLHNAGITTGYEDGTFRPDQKISRQQFAVMLYRYLGLDETKYADVELPFADNGKLAEYAIPAIKALYTEGIINGSTGKDGKLYFNPNSSLTRAQAATMIGRTQEKGYAAVDLAFTDAAKIPGYATAYIRTMAAQGIISGYTDGSFKPNNPITRGQMAKILYNLM